MRSCDEVKKRKSKIYYRYVPTCNGCNIGYRNVLHKVVFKEFKQSPVRVDAVQTIDIFIGHRGLLSLICRFSESGHQFLARSKISHILADLASPGSKCVS